MKKFLKVLLGTSFALLYLFSVGSCGYGGGGGGYGAGFGGAYADKEVAGGMDAPTEGENGALDEDASMDEESKKEEEIVQKPAGLITAGAWNDNDNYEYWKTLFSQDEETTGKFYEYSKAENSWGFNSYNRVKVTVKNGETPVAGATVTAKNEKGDVFFTSKSDANGVAYVFTDEQAGIVEAVSGAGQATAEFTLENREIEIELGENEVKKNIIELMFVVDVTGSMGDELSFLNNEIADVVNRVTQADSATQINLALLFYRDHVDSEVFKYYDFEDVTNADGLAKQQAAIAAQRASGGGDYAEAVEEALAMAVEKQWSEAATTKIIFQVLDAPPHSGRNNQTKMNAAAIAAAAKGIRVCPVLCSGADEVTEYVMRQTAVYTGGTFVFVTDDSGIGNPHYDPNLPNVTVEALNSLMVRLINGYHSGTFAEPIDWRQEVK